MYHKLFTSGKTLEYTMQGLDDLATSDLYKLEKLAGNFEWFSLQHDSLKKDFNRRYVAIEEKQVVDCDTSLERLIKRLKIQNYDNSIAIEYVYNWFLRVTTIACKKCTVAESKYYLLT